MGALAIERTEQCPLAAPIFGYQKNPKRRCMALGREVPLGVARGRCWNRDHKQNDNSSMFLSGGCQPTCMGRERRRVPRFPFDGTADIILESSGARTSARVREISLYGCRLETASALPAKTRLLVRIFGPSEFIEAAATVIFASLDLGTGLAFRAIEPDFEYILRRWLRQALERDLA